MFKWSRITGYTNYKVYILQCDNGFIGITEKCTLWAKHQICLWFLDKGCTICYCFERNTPNQQRYLWPQLFNLYDVFNNNNNNNNAHLRIAPVSAIYHSRAHSIVCYPLLLTPVISANALSDQIRKFWPVQVMIIGDLAIV